MTQLPCWTCPTNQCGIIGRMENATSRDILAKNLWRMIEAEARTGEKPSIRAWAMKRGLNVRMIDRLVKRQHAVTLDTLELIAAALGLKPWHLLLEELEPGAMPDAPITEADRALLHKLRKLLGD